MICHMVLQDPQHRAAILRYIVSNMFGQVLWSNQQTTYCLLREGYINAFTTLLQYMIEIIQGPKEQSVRIDCSGMMCNISFLNHR